MTSSGLPSSQSVGRRGGLGRSAGSPCGMPWSSQRLKRRDGSVVEAAVAGEVAKARLGEPRGHDAGGDGGGDLLAWRRTSS